MYFASPAVAHGSLLLANESHMHLFLAVFIQLLCYEEQICRTGY